VLDSELFASAGEGFGEVAATIVSHDAFVARKPPISRLGLTGDNLLRLHS
jgi:hypothetical protein